eukprot:5312043-Pyramimonas_sp.AAC.2
MAARLTASMFVTPSVKARCAAPKLQSRITPRRRCLTVHAMSEEGGLKGFANKMGKKVTGNENYEFGDLTKKAAKVVKEGVTELGKEITGDENYQVGDLTKKAASAVEKEAAHLAE